MTTATDWDVRDRDTSDRLTVTDVQARIDHLDGAATEAPVQIEPWIPRDPHARERCRCGEYHESALIAPASDVLYAEGSTIAAEMVRGIDRTPGWPTWLGDVHHADARLGSEISKTHAWADSYTARPVERTVVQPVEEDTRWRVSNAALYARMVVEAAERHVESVYSELAPEQIAQDSPADVPGQNREAHTPTDVGSGAGPSSPAEWPERQPSPPGATDGPPHRLPPPPPPPADRSALDKLKERVPTALTTGEQSAAEPEPEPPRVGGWRVWVASAAIGIVGLAATIGIVGLAATIGALVVWA